MVAMAVVVGVSAVVVLVGTEHGVKTAKRCREIRDRNMMSCKINVRTHKCTKQHVETAATSSFAGRRFPSGFSFEGFSFQVWVFCSASLPPVG